MKIYRNIRYNKSHVLDLYIPQHSQTNVTSVIMYLHGGAWISANTANAEEIAVVLASKGFCMVVPNYTTTRTSVFQFVLSGCFLIAILPLIIPTYTEHVSLSKMTVLCTLFLVVCFTFCYYSQQRNDSSHPQHFDDIQDAMTWVQDNLLLYGVSIRNIVFMGHSAGAHIACVTSHMLPNVAGVVGISGPYSATKMTDNPFCMLLVKTVFVSDFEKAFPIYHVHTDSPPHLLLNASSDFGLSNHTKEYLYTLKKKNVRAYAHTFPNTNHFSIRRNWDSRNRTVVKEIECFIRSLPSS